MATQDTYSAEEARKKMESLPEEVKNFLYSPDMLTAVRKVGEKNQLHIDQIGILQAETTSVMLGFTETHDFPYMLSQALNVDVSKATAIAKDLDDTLFSQIRSSMKKADEHATAVPTTVIAAPPAVATPPMPEKSVVMPSATKALTPAVAPLSLPVTPPVAPAPKSASTPAPVVTPPPPIEKPASMPAMQHVDAMLSAPTVSIAPKPAAPTIPTPTPDVKKSDAPAPPPTYKTDPYHEPID